MDITIYPRKLSGTLEAIPSKSQAHRLLICAAFADAPVTLICKATNQDIEATADCLRALGAGITRTENGYDIQPIQHISDSAVLNCRESGSTLRFMLPIAASLGVDCTFLMSGRLPARPLSPLWEELERMGCKLTRPTENTLRCQGKLRSGLYSIDGGVSSQFITGLLFALSLLPGDNQLEVFGNIESKPYIQMTEQALALFGVNTDNYLFHNERFHSPGTVNVEGDWSNSAFFLAANKLDNHVTVTGLNESSFQGDRAVTDILDNLSENITVQGQDIPDLIPILAVISGARSGASFQNIGRLRLKESDRIESVAQMLSALGAETVVTPDSLTVFPASYHTCVIDSQNDHRIAMSAAIASTVATGPITLLGAECVSKSYPNFWSEFSRLGGYYEQYIR